MTQQEIFDKVLAHLRKQGKAALHARWRFGNRGDSMIRAALTATLLAAATPAGAVSLMKPATGAAEVAAPLPAPAAAFDKTALEKAIANVPASARRAPRPDLQRQIEKPAYPWVKGADK